MHLLQQVRSSSRSPRPLPQIILHTVLAALLGALLGFLAKYADSISIIGHIGTRLGIWIFLATMLAAFSPSPHAAAVSTFSFFAGMLGAYYAYSSVLFGFFPRHYVLAWGFFALLSPLGAYLVWFSRGRGWLASFCAALPISILLAEGYSFYYTLSIAQGFELSSALLLLLLLPRDNYHRLCVLLSAIPLAFVLRYLNVLSLVFGGL